MNVLPSIGIPDAQDAKRWFHRFREECGADANQQERRIPDEAIPPELKRPLTRAKVTRGEHGSERIGLGGPIAIRNCQTHLGNVILFNESRARDNQQNDASTFQSEAGLVGEVTADYADFTD
jgi:hypothetical protein